VLDAGEQVVERFPTNQFRHDVRVCAQDEVAYDIDGEGRGSVGFWAGRSGFLGAGSVEKVGHGGMPPGEIAVVRRVNVPDQISGYPVNASKTEKPANLLENCLPQPN
jgi:hypothetical protein